MIKRNLYVISGVLMLGVSALVLEFGAHTALQVRPVHVVSRANVTDTIKVNYNAPVVKIGKPVTYQQDPSIIPLTNRLGLDTTHLNLIAGADPVLPDAVAAFTGPDKLYITDNAPQAVLDRVVSHEYMHYVQTQHKAEAASFYPYLDDLMNSNTWLYDRMAWYRTDYCPATAKCLPIEAEAEAISCSEVSDNYLDSSFISFCNKYLPHRYDLDL